MKKTSKNFCVYKVISPSNKVYIGITAEELSTRKYKHNYVAKKYNNCKFHRCIRKYGIDNLKWVVLKTGLSQNLAIKYEMYYIKKYNSYKVGYNSTKGGEGAFGYKWNRDRFDDIHKIRIDKFYNNVEWKRKQSEITKTYLKNNPNVRPGKYLIEYMNKNRHVIEPIRLDSIRSVEARTKNCISNGGKPFNVYDFVEKRYIGTWLIQADCAKELNITSSKISACLNYKRNIHKKYIFKYTDDTSVINTEFNEIWLNSIKRKPNDL